MAISNKPIVWGPFAAGGALTAFVTPVLIVLSLLAATGHMPAIFDYDKLHAFAAGWFGKLSTFVVICLSLWGCMHRLRCTFFDFGVRADGLVAIVVYLVAGAGSIMTLVYLVRI
jgi:fumarate reductase subunit D